MIVDPQVSSDHAQGPACAVQPRHRRSDPLIGGRQVQVAERDLKRDPGDGANVYLPRPPFPPISHIPGGGAYFNAGGIDTSGLEFSATVQLPQRTSFYTAFTFNESEYIGTGDPLVDASQGLVAGTDVTGVPDRLWVVSLDRTGPLGMGLTAKYTSSRRVSLRSDAYVSCSGRALSDLLRSTEFAIVANNLLDKAYLSAITENAAWLGAPRTISMTATVSF